MQKARRHRTRAPPTAASFWTRCYFTPASGVLFTFPSRYSFTIGRQGVLSLAGWSPRVPTRFSVPGRTQELVKEGCALSPCRTVTAVVRRSTGSTNTQLYASRPMRQTDQDEPYNPRTTTYAYHIARVWAPFARHYSGESRFFPFLRVLRCFSSPGLPLPALWIQAGVRPHVGFPIRKSPDQRMVSSFPGLIAAAHVLHRLLAPSIHRVPLFS